MQIIARSSAGMLIIQNGGREYTYFSVPDSIIRKVKRIIRNGGQAWNLLKPYSAKAERGAMVERDKAERGATI